MAGDTKTTPKMLGEDYNLDFSGQIPGATGGAAWKDQIDKWQKENPFVPKQHQWGTNWTKEEYDKHLGEMNEKYPGLNKLLLNGSRETNANLRTHANTDKYARLADAYNAKYIYKPGSWSGDGGFKGTGTWTPGQYVPVEKIDTQDQKQMDQLRSAQGDLRKYNLENETHYQQQYLKQKMEEAMQLTNQGYTEAFFNSNEEMRRTKELFDMFRDMSKEQFVEVMKNYRMPAAQAARMKQMIDEGRLFEAMLFGEKLGLSQQSADQVFLALEGGKIIKDLATGAQTSAQIAERLGEMKGEVLISQVTGIYNAAIHNQGVLSPELKQTAATLKLALQKANQLGATVVNNAEIIAGGAALAWTLAQALGIAAAVKK